MEREVYPKHLYEQIRREIGVDYVRHELLNRVVPKESKYYDEFMRDLDLSEKV